MLYWLIVTTLNPFRSLEARLGSARATRARASRAPPSPLERRLWNTSSSRDDDPRLVPVRELFVFLVIRGVPVPIQAITFIVGLSVFVVRVESPRLIPSRDPSSHPSNVVCFPRESRHRSRDPSIHHKQTNHASSPSSSSNRVARRASHHVRHGSKQRDRTKQPGIHHVLLDPLRHACGPILKQPVHHPGAHRGERVRHRAQTRRDFTHVSVVVRRIRARVSAAPRQTIKRKR